VSSPGVHKCFQKSRLHCTTVSRPRTLYPEFVHPWSSVPVFSRRIFARRLQRAEARGGWIKSLNESFYNGVFRPRRPVAEWCTNPGRRLAVATKLCAVAPYIHGACVWSLLDITLLTPTILRRLLDFRKICALLV
jgi:hypothetical protein